MEKFQYFIGISKLFPSRIKSAQQPLCLQDLFNEVLLMYAVEHISQYTWLCC